MAESTYKGRPIRYFLIDRLAAGFEPAQACQQFRLFFDLTDGDEEIMGLLGSKDEAERLIEERRQEILREIDRTNITGLILKQIRKIDQLSDDSNDIGDLVKVTGVLNDSLAALRVRKDIAQAPNKQLQINYYNQFNATFLTDLEGQGIIKILEREKFERLFLGAAAPGQLPVQSELAAQADGQKPKKKQRAQEAGPDEVASFL